MRVLSNATLRMSGVLLAELSTSRRNLRMLYKDLDTRLSKYVYDAG